MCPGRKVVVVDMAHTTPGPAGRQVVRGDLTVTKRPDPGAHPAPGVTLSVSSEYDVPVAVRIVEPLPDDFDPDRLCVPATRTDHWTVADDGLAWSGHVPPGGEAEAEYGVLPADAEQVRTMLGAPVVDAVHPAATTGEGEPRWRTAGRAAEVRTMDDVAAEESPAALAAAEATVRAALTGREGADAAPAPAEAATGAGAGEVPAGETARADPEDAESDRTDDDRTDDDSATPDRTKPDHRHLRVVFDPDAAPRERERALREFARAADVAGCTPGVGRVAAGRADTVRLRVAGVADGVAARLREQPAVRRVVDVTAAPDPTPEGRPRPERTFQELKREHDPVPPAELERELADATADGGQMAEESVSLGDLLAEHDDATPAKPDAVEDGDATGADASGAADSGSETPTDVESGDAVDPGESSPTVEPVAADDDVRAAVDRSERTLAADPPASPEGSHFVAALVAALDGRTDDHAAALRAALDVPAREDHSPALGERVERLEAAVADLEASLERLTALRPFAARLLDRTEAVETAVESLTDEAGEARIDRSVLESDVEELSRAVAALRERVAEVEGTDSGPADRLHDRGQTGRDDGRRTGRDRPPADGS